METGLKFVKQKSGLLTQDLSGTSGYERESANFDAAGNKRTKRFILEGIRLLGTAFGQVKKNQASFVP